MVANSYRLDVKQREWEKRGEPCKVKANFLERRIITKRRMGDRLGGNGERKKKKRHK